MEPEIALVAASVETDVNGAGLNLNPQPSKRSSQRTRDTAVVVYGSPCSSAFTGRLFTGRLYDQHCYHAAARKSEQSIGNR